MPLRRELQEFDKHCSAIVDLVRAYPHLLTDEERLNIEGNIAEVMSAIVETGRLLHSKK